MINIDKYRKLSTTAMIIMTLSWMTAMAALWNSVLHSNAKNEGWVVVFMIVVLISGAFVFFIAYDSSDISRMEKIKQDAFEAGKSEIILETENQKKAEVEKKNETENLQAAVDKILAGIHGVRSENSLCTKLLSALSKELEFVQSIIYILNKQEGIYNPVAEYALTDRKPLPFKEGEGIPGQVAANKSMTILYDIPENYIVVSSGLGSSQPRYLLIVPVISEDNCVGVIEIASFKKPDDTDVKILEKVLTEVGPKINKFITA